MRNLIKEFPVIGPLMQNAYRKWINPRTRFTDSHQYWIDRYAAGGNSGEGSYGKFSEFKANFLNGFIRQENIESIIEFGCGDGNQLKLAKYPAYIGFDISPKAIALCREIFSGDAKKEFRMQHEFAAQKAQLALSLDVIFHLVEDEVFVAYMDRLFESAEEFVIIYSSNSDPVPGTGVAHVRHRKFSDWIENSKPDWKPCKRIRNQYPYTGDNQTGSCSDFHVYTKDPAKRGPA